MADDLDPAAVERATAAVVRSMSAFGRDMPTGTARFLAREALTAAAPADVEGLGCAHVVGCGCAARQPAPVVSVEQVERAAESIDRENDSRPEMVRNVLAALGIEVQGRG